MENVEIKTAINNLFLVASYEDEYPTKVEN